MYPFLAPSAPAASEVLVLEGWIPDAPMEEALAWAATNGIQKIWVTGGPVETGSWLAPWKTYAEMTRARLEKMGATERFQVEAFPAPHTRKDRTLVSAMALKTALGSGRLPAALTLASEGPHTRRSRLLFRRALGPEVVVGSLALTPSEYEPRDWWKSSAGFRSVISEAIAYPYAVFFSPDP